MKTLFALLEDDKEYTLNKVRETFDPNDEEYSDSQLNSIHDTLLDEESHIYTDIEDSYIGLLYSYRDYDQLAFTVESIDNIYLHLMSTNLSIESSEGLKHLERLVEMAVREITLEDEKENKKEENSSKENKEVEETKKREIAQDTSPYKIKEGRRSDSSARKAVENTSIISKMYNRLKKLFEKLTLAFKEFVGKVFVGVKTFRKHLVQLKSDLNKVKSWDKDLPVKLGDYRNRVFFKGSYETKDVLAGMEHTTKVSSAIYKDYLEGSKAFLKTLANRITDFSRDKKPLEDLDKENSTASPFSKSRVINKEMVDLLKKGNNTSLPGGLSIEALIEDDEVFEYNIVPLAIVPDKKHTRPPKDNTIASGEVSVLSELLTVSDNLLNDLESAEIDMKQIHIEMKRVRTSMETYIKSTEANKKIIKYNSEASKKILKSTTKDITKGISNYTKMVWNLVRGILLYAKEIYKAQVEDAGGDKALKGNKKIHSGKREIEN